MEERKALEAGFRKPPPRACVRTAVSGIALPGKLACILLKHFVSPFLPSKPRIIMVVTYSAVRIK